MATAASTGSDSEFLTLKQDFETWRKTRVHREAIPESLWMRAVELARRLGVTLNNHTRPPRLPSANSLA